jgi:hypothetical protein
MWAAIDPMAMILSGKALDIWYQMHHTHTPKVSAIQEVLKAAASEELKATLSRAKAQRMRIGNMNALRRQWPRPRDIRCQTRTLGGSFGATECSR